MRADAAAIVAVLLLLGQAPRDSLIGFAASRQSSHRDAEARFLAGVSTDRISEIHRIATERPHIAGSAASLGLADRLQQALRDAGLRTEAFDYQVYLSTPRRVAAAIVAPESQGLEITEPHSPIDEDSAHRELGPGFVAYSASGSVSAPAVYVNYGLPDDYARLEKAGVDVRGHIAIARYARSHRAVKIHTAETRGAVGIIIYSDPADDGAARGAVWPKGPWRADFQVQRGNGKYSWFWHGDPLTPGIAATRDAVPIDPATAPTLPRIPAIVISSREAAKILARLTGPPAPEGFQGGLPFAYRLGPGAVNVRMDVQMETGRRTIRNVIARIAGRDSTRQVMLGTHHDAWTFGGMDPGSGLSAVFEVARGLAALTRSGWQPERDLVFAFWDAEEFGLIGSTEFAEQFQKTLREQLITYINTDLFMRGRFDGGGTPSLRDFLVEVTRDVSSFTGQGSVYDSWRGNRSGEVELAALGSGADFVAFQDFLGVPTLQMEFDFEGSYGTYHSNYDTRWYVEHFSDPNFAVARTLAQLLGLAVMRLGSADVLPFRYSHYGSTIRSYLETAPSWTNDGEQRAQLVTSLGPARDLAGEIERLASKIEARIARQLADGSLQSSEAKALNDALFRLEQSLLDEREPARDRWYRHVVYGWNIYSLYEGQPVPGLAAAIRSGDAAMQHAESERILFALRRMRASLESIAK
jgi:N-acetylated-alpha-linked acidic dipeptidase